MKNSTKILQEKIIKQLESKNIDSNDFEYTKAKIKEIIDETKLIELDRKLKEYNFENKHFLSEFNSILTEIL
jgi:predicted N-acyltransferase